MNLGSLQKNAIDVGFFHHFQLLGLRKQSIQNEDKQSCKAVSELHCKGICLSVLSNLSMHGIGTSVNAWREHFQKGNLSSSVWAVVAADSSRALGLGIFPSRTTVHTVIMGISFPVAVTVEVTVKAYYCPTRPFFQALNLCGVVLYSRVKKPKSGFFYCLRKVDWCCVKKGMKRDYSTGINSSES